MEYPKPVVEFDDSKQPTRLSYDVPQPSSYSGKNCVELKFIQRDQDPKSFFHAKLFNQPPRTPTVLPQAVGDAAKTVQQIHEDLTKGVVTQGAFRGSLTSGRMSVRTNVPADEAGKRSWTGVPIRSNKGATLEIATVGNENRGQLVLTPEQIGNAVASGMRLKVYTSMYGVPKVRSVPAAPTIRPRILLVETHRISSYLGDYGAGRVLSTASLLPGEKTRITVRSYTKESSTRVAASSVLDSFTKESADDFEESLQSEQSRKDNSEESFEYHAEAEAEAGWGWGSADVSGGVKGTTAASREEFVKNVANATSKHAQKASAKRDVQINTSSTTTAETGNETETLREIQNINVSRTLTFVFRQMNQEFVTIHHLVDLRLAFFNGDPAQTREYTLPELEDLLDDVILPAKKDEVRDAIIAALTDIHDYLGKEPTMLDMDGNAMASRKFVEEQPLSDKSGATRKYRRFSRDGYSQYKLNDRQTIKGIQGIIVGVTRNTMRTDGVIVDTLLGGGNGLDSYSTDLQVERVRADKLHNDERQLAIKIVDGTEGDRAAAFAQVFHAPRIQKP